MTNPFDDIINNIPDIRQPVNQLLNGLPTAPEAIQEFAGCPTIFAFEQGQIYRAAKQPGGQITQMAEANTQCARRKVQAGDPQGIIGYPVQWAIDNFATGPTEAGLNWVRLADKWVNKGPPIPNNLIPSAVRQKLGWGNE
jgi:hypothetical protein